MSVAFRNIAALVTLTALAGLAVAWFAAATKGDVERNRLEAQTRILRELAGVAIEAPTRGDLLLCDRGQVIVRGTGRGYGGEFKIAVAVGANGKIQGVRVIEHAETPGFGDILDAASEWLNSFPDGEVHAVTGATVTSQSVVRAVERVVARADLKTLCP